MELEIQHTSVFSKNLEAINNPDIRFIINQGGSRSSKTYSLCQLLIVICLTKVKTISIIRKSFPSLRGSIMRDFFEIMRELNIYNEKNHNKTENYYKFDNGSMIEFFSADDEQKLRGRKRDILFCNEANELNFEEYVQLNLRTTEKLIFDYNPSDSHHFLYELISKENSQLIKSTYKDNPFLNDYQVKEIEDLINIDISYYNIYALGERGIGKTTIYTHHKMFEGDIDNYKEIMYGLDLGYNDPCALVECKFIDKKVYVKELLYKSGLTSSDLIRELDRMGISKSKYIIVDNARPEVIEDLKRAGYPAKASIKEVKAGIDSVKSSELFIHKESLNLLKEISNYKWKTNGDIILDEPVKKWDHICDSMRYCIHYWKLLNKNSGVNYLKFY